MNKETAFSYQFSALSMKRIWNFVVTAVVATASIGWAADPIKQQITSKDAAQIQQAVASVRQQLQAVSHRDRRVAVLGLTREGHWLADLMNAERCDEVARLSLEATVALPWDVSLVEYLQTYRARALLKLGRPQEALAVAKGQFNVCRMKSTADNLLLLVDCLKAAYPGDASIVDRLRDEQITGSALTQSSVIGSQLSVLGLRSSVLDSVKVDATAYEAAIAQYTSDDYGNLMSRGNLLLLADRPKEARTAFEKAYAVASDNDLATATESIARCLRAEDGTTGRANAWVLSIRPTAGH